MKLLKRHKLTLCYIGLILICLLMGNSNNTPVTYMERIFKPISFGSGTLYYANIIAILIIYYSLKAINDNKEHYFIKSISSRIITMIVLVSIVTWSGEYITKFYKSFYNNLNSIYMNRDETSIEFNFDDNKANINGQISIINYSNKIQEFNIKIKSPTIVKNYTKEDYITVKNNVKIYPKEEIRIYVDEELDKIEGLQYSTQAFEYILFNNKDKTVFKGNIEDYNSDY